MTVASSRTRSPICGRPYANRISPAGYRRRASDDAVSADHDWALRVKRAPMDARHRGLFYPCEREGEYETLEFYAASDRVARLLKKTVADVSARDELAREHWHGPFLNQQQPGGPALLLGSLWIAPLHRDGHALRSVISFLRVEAAGRPAYAYFMSAKFLALVERRLRPPRQTGERRPLVLGCRSPDL
jgi:hypothetical protein